ncbi:TlpA family protein disulfide reductase [Lutibacter sp. A80]|uniref:TlpA family protein disulfide reductase n=1 Tax=Lutibacter sp. A80 TaxID=2918453 RepID=UPI001F070AEE|nr:TlpA disulfide reductase family protein [Lutibacter sp. A80]UMB59394.1 TlpA family protein disulfide reductase [Lutibacter sp. A80]
MKLTNYLNLLTILFLTLVLNGCTTKNNNSFIISGNISDLETDYIILSEVKDIQSKKALIIDTLKVDKRGKFDAVYFLEPNIYNLTFNSNKTLQLAINKGQHIKINGSLNDDLIVSGSNDTQLLTDYETFRKNSLNRLVTSVRDRIKNLKQDGNEQLITSLRTLEVENYKIHLNELAQFIKDTMGTSIAIYPTSIRWNNENLETLGQVVSNFKDAHPNLEITNKLVKKIELLKKTSIGSSISNIKMPDQFNKLINLDTIKGKYTLIDFWASWCPPCRAESKLLNKLYNDYNSNGFEIYGISLDSNKERWLKALKTDNRTWTNVSTVEGFKTAVAIEYGISSLPTNYIIDREGKIIASNLHGEKLAAFIKKLYN